MELLLVVAITLILSAVSIPVFVRSLEGNQLKTAARSVNRMHRYARAMAVLKGIPVYFQYDSEERIMTVSTATNTPPMIQRAFPEKVSLKEFTCESDDSFDEDPLVKYSTSGQCADFTLTLTDTSNHEITVEIDGIAGSARFEDE